MNSETTLSVRCPGDNANHHLWNNNGTWWCHFTLHLDGLTKRRVRRSLETRDLARARHLRDALLGSFTAACPLPRHAP